MQMNVVLYGERMEGDTEIRRGNDMAVIRGGDTLK